MFIQNIFRSITTASFKNSLKSFVGLQNKTKQKNDVHITPRHKKDDTGMASDNFHDCAVLI